MKKSIQVGDRVAAYDFHHLEGARRVVGKVTFANAVRIEIAGNGDWHPKQCRRLKRKPKPREWVLHINKSTNLVDYSWFQVETVNRRPTTDEYEVRVREVLK